MATVYLSLGSNLGDRQEAIRRAVEYLNQYSDINVIQTSSVYETEPWGLPDQKAFLNLAAEIQTTLAPVILLKVCKKIEKTLGRKRRIRWGPRKIDIDILLYEDQQIDQKKLKVPHPRLLKRKFVLVPLAEIAPEVRISGSGLTVRQAMEKCRDDKRVKLI